MKIRQLIKPLAMLTAAIGSALSLSACGDKLVNCNGVSKDGKGVIAGKGACSKIADSRITPLTAAQAKTAKPYPISSYVKCYGIAAAGKNDCGTKSTACSGSVGTSRQSDAWIALPKGLCEKLRGARVVTPKKEK